MNERNVQARGDISGRVFTGDLYININSDKVEITYIKKEINGINHEDILKEINISLATNTELNQKALPFIPPDKYNQWKDERNLFLYGIGGAGKTRSILKILEDKINEKDSYNNLKSRNIYLIYPQKITEAKIEKTTISKIVKELHENDILIWDNFPLDIEGKQEPEIGWKLLSNLSSGNKATLLVTLYSDYFELYNPEVLRKGLSELRMELVTYSKEKIEEFLDVYGNNISEFKCLYKEFVEKNKHIISQNLWRNEPTPLTVYIYYTELVKTKKNSWLNPAITLSEKLPTSDRYYTEQFKSIFSYRRNESEFLCTLKLCYDLGIERTSGSYLKKNREKYLEAIFQNIHQKILVHGFFCLVLIIICMI